MGGESPKVQENPKGNSLIEGRKKVFHQKAQHIRKSLRGWKRNRDRLSEPKKKKDQKKKSRGERKKESRNDSRNSRKTEEK